MPAIRKKQATKQILSVTFLVLLLALAGLGLANRTKVKQLLAGTQATATPKSSPLPTTSPLIVQESTGFPVKPQTPNVGNVFVHYFFSAPLGKIDKTAEGTVLTLTTTNTAIPPLTITADVRVSTITPPYSQATTKFISVDELRIGQNVDISAEYEASTGKWYIRDVFLPTDRN